VTSTSWDGNTGAATWGSGDTGIAGPVLPSNSLVGSASGQQVGSAAIALVNGNYAVVGRFWSDGIAAGQGALVWCRAGGGTTGAVSGARSLHGATKNDQVGSGGGRAFSDGNYAVASLSFKNGSTSNYGAVTLGSGRFRLKGSVAPWNSVIGGIANGSLSSYDYDPARHRLLVGRPSENIVSLFTMDQIFADDLDP
jgi:hypothetical protein